MTQTDFKASFLLVNFLRYETACHKYVQIKMHNIKPLQMASKLLLLHASHFYIFSGVYW
jgi:hypothetical protein